MSKNIVIVGAGPAGLTAARELQVAGEKSVIVIEADNCVGGISRTANHNGNRIDIGGHRFFSKSDWVMSWWQEYLPIVPPSDDGPRSFKYQGQELPSKKIKYALSDDNDSVMLTRNRMSRIYFNQQFFDYPLKLNVASLRKLGLKKTVVFGLSYMMARIRPISPEKSLQDFLVNRFGWQLYRQFFKEYTEKVWGVPCQEISAEWGAQRIKSLSILKAVTHALKSSLGLNRGRAEQTSLIESFIYPKFGPGQMWEKVAGKFVEEGGTLHMRARVIGVNIQDSKVKDVTVRFDDGSEEVLPCSHLISTMPIKELVEASESYWSKDIVGIAKNLQYRDFFTVGLLYAESDMREALKDNWIYIQEPGVSVGRVQIFNNWSPYLVSKPGTVWLGLEFFCKEIDDIWKKTDEELISLAQSEINKIALVRSEKALDAVVLRVPKAYPGYFGSAYKEFDKVKKALDDIENMFLIGRNGMHRYNNQDHSMLTAKEAADQIVCGVVNKNKIWGINVDDDYHEEKKMNQ